MKEPIKIVCCYARKDQQFLIELKAHLSPLSKQGLISLWADTDISVGTEWESEVNRHLDQAEIILLLVSADFVASDYCYSKEMEKAIQLRESGKAQVIPIILRHTRWQGTPLGTLQALPQDGIPITSWVDRDAAFLDVIRGIEQAVQQIITRRSFKPYPPNRTNSMLGPFYPDSGAGEVQQNLLPTKVDHQHPYEESLNGLSVLDELAKDLGLF